MILQAEVCLIPRSLAACAVESLSQSTYWINLSLIQVTHGVLISCICSIFWCGGVLQPFLWNSKPDSNYYINVKKMLEFDVMGISYRQSIEDMMLKARRRYYGKSMCFLIINFRFDHGRSISSLLNYFSSCFWVVWLKVSSGCNVCPISYTWRCMTALFIRQTCLGLQLKVLENKLDFAFTRKRIIKAYEGKCSDRLNEPNVKKMKYIAGCQQQKDDSLLWQLQLAENIVLSIQEQNDWLSSVIQKYCPTYSLHFFLLSNQKNVSKNIPYQDDCLQSHMISLRYIHKHASVVAVMPIMIVILYQQSNHFQTSNMSSKFSFSSTFNWQDGNLKSLLHPILFSTERHNDKDQPFCHFTHKNMGTKMAPFREQEFRLYLDDLTNIKYISIDNYTHGAEMTISISDSQHGEFTEVYKDEYICKGKTLKNSNKLVDIGALPCRSIRIRVKKGCNISSKNIALIGIESSQIEERLGEDYFKLLVANPMKILYLI